MEKPIIGLTCAWSVETWGNTLEHGGYYYVGSYYANAISKSGGFPLILAIPPKEELIEDFVEEVLLNVDGLLFTGGGDAKRFGKEEMPSLREQQPHRYSFEERLLVRAWESDIVTMGICRGFQMMVEVFGGKLFDGTIEGHKQKAPGFTASHKVKVSEGSKLYLITGASALEVNSFHVQAVEVVPKGFLANAISEDGIVEGIEAKDKSFFLGFQFHPEERYEFDPYEKKIFDAFIKASRGRRRGRK